ncbi:MAG: hypothetical protein ABUL62_24905 [Myxococcales bacterium]
MGARGRGLGALALALVASCWIRPAAAAKPGQAFRLEYWAEGHCPDAVEFARQIQTRAPRLRPAEADEPALGFYAELAEHAGSATGRLTARSADGREVVREVRGPTCEDVSTALALIAALAADPTQSAEPAKPVVPTAPVAPAPRAPRLETVSADLPDSKNPLYRWTYGVGGGLEFDSSIAPSPGYGLGITFDAEGPGGAPARLLLSVSAIRAAAANTETAGGSASFTWLGLRLAACPMRWPEETPLFFRPCAFFDAGVLSGDVSSSDASRDRSRTWAATGGFGRIEELVGDVVSFQLDVGVTVPLTRPSFDSGGLAPTAFQVPSAGILGRIGLSYRFQ